MLTYTGAGFRYETDATWEERGAVTDVNLRVPPSAFLLLTGGSGSGKSTLVRMGNGLIPHFHPGAFCGTVRVDGTDTRECPVRELTAKVGVVFQNQEAQLFNATVAGELAFGPRSQGLTRAEITARVQWAAERTGIAHLLSRSTQHLSGGEAARVAIASVLTMRPPILMLDEPSAALDPLAVAALWELLGDLNRGGTGIVIAEHRVESAWEQGCSMAVMRDGRLVFHGMLADALRVPLETRDFALPHVVRLFVEAGLPERPTHVAEAATIIRSRCLRLQPRREDTPAPGDLLMHADGLTYERDRGVILDGVEVRLHRGEAVALVGANGAGKTTLLRLLAGLVSPRRGRVIGSNGQPYPRGRLGLLLQNADHALFCPTVRQEVEYSARLLGRYDPDWLHELHVRFALESLLDRPPLSLSDGEKRRVALAAILGHRPDVVLLDEPTAGQDTLRREALAAMIAALRRGGVAVLLATHDLAFAAAHCPRWLVLADGTMIADGPPASILDDAAMCAYAHLLPTPVAHLAATLGVRYPGEQAILAGDALISDSR